MLVLALDTSTPALTVAAAPVDAAAGSSATVERSVVAANRHGELLAPLIDRVLREAAADRAALTAVAVGLGPGPFTGLRVGIVTAASLADALHVRAYGVCSLDALAAGVDNAGQPFAVVTDARRKQVYWARYDGGRRRVGGPDLARPDELAERLRDEVPLVAGAGAHMYAPAFASYRVLDGYPQAAHIIGLVAERVRTAAPAERLEPMYLRRPDARPPGAPKRVTPV